MKDMLGRDEVISKDAALGLILDGLSARLPEEEVVHICDALGRICSADIYSPEELPHFDRSTVDGYAVKAEDTFGSSEAVPAYLTLGEEVFMGERPGFSVSRGLASKIPTGGMIPEGADAVVMFEHVQASSPGIIEVMRPAAPGENIIRSGEDVEAGALLFGKGHMMRPQDSGACAGLGITEIRVYRKLRVSIISTGDEIVSASETPGFGQVRDINSHLLSDLVRDAGHLPLNKGIFRDDYAGIRKVVDSSRLESDLVLISGGTSVGTKDMMERVINDIGSPGVKFHGVALKPGKPLIGGIMSGVPVFGLPGHPAAVGVCFDIFVRPVLKRISGLVEKIPVFSKRSATARLSRNISSSPGREEHVRVMLEHRPDGLWAVPVLGKSGLITTLVKADGVVIVPLKSNGIQKEETVEVFLF